MKTFAAVIAALIFFVAGVQLGIHHGRELGWNACMEQF